MLSSSIALSKVSTLFILMQLTSLLIFFTNPVKTFPGPISINVSTPFAIIYLTESENFTGFITWFDKISLILSDSLYSVASKFFITLQSGILIYIFSSSSLKALDAFSNFLVWKGPLVFNSITLLAPASFASSISSLIPSLSPETAT